MYRKVRKIVKLAIKCKSVSGLTVVFIFFSFESNCENFDLISQTFCAFAFIVPFLNDRQNNMTYISIA